ncbi:hypothetical protein ACGFJT_20605 [Actinomadura geliboluensis]|uniref:hypothetical protein n=1 Tax=Actinomadura geliboluensis TaxID=882440 RepID=UPI00372051B5
MRKIAKKAMMVTAVAASAVALTAVPAAAAVTTVVINPSGTNVALTATNSGNVIGANDRTGAALVCTGLTASGVLLQGGTLTIPPADAEKLAKVTSVSFSGCTVLGNPATVTANVSSTDPWWIGVTGATSGTSTPGKLTGVDVTINVPALGCTSTAKGPGTTEGFIPGVHIDRTSSTAPSKLTLPPPPNQGDNIVLENVSATCPSTIAANGDSVSIAGTLNINPGLTVLAT